MRTFSLLAVLSILPAMLATQPARDFLNFRTEPLTPFGKEAAEKLASAQFRERYGACGMVVFKERKFEAWVFETRIGYGGRKGPDIVIYSTSASSLPDLFGASESKPNKAPEPTRTAAP